MTFCRCGAELSGPEFSSHWRRYHAPAQRRCADCDYTALCLSDALAHSFLEGHGRKQSGTKPLEELINMILTMAGNIPLEFSLGTLALAATNTESQSQATESMQIPDATKPETQETKDPLLDSESLPMPCPSEVAKLEDTTGQKFDDMVSKKEEKNDDEPHSTDYENSPMVTVSNELNNPEVVMFDLSDDEDVYLMSMEEDEAVDDSLLENTWAEDDVGESCSSYVTSSNGSAEVQDSSEPSVEVDQTDNKKTLVSEPILIDSESENQSIDPACLKECEETVINPNSDLKEADTKPNPAKDDKGRTEASITDQMQKLDLPEPSDEKQQKSGSLGRLGFNAKALGGPQSVRKLRHSCLKCGKSYRHSMLKDHISTQHYKQPLFRCKLCPYFTYLYVNDLLMRDHVRRKHQAIKVIGWKPYFTDYRGEHLAQLNVLAKNCFPALDIVFQASVSKTSDRESLASIVKTKDYLSSISNINGQVSSEAAPKCNLCSQPVRVSQRKNHIMLEHSDSTAVFQCRHCNHSSPYWTGEFKQLAKHLANNHPGKGHWRKEMLDRRAQLSPFISAMTEICFPFSDQSKTEMKKYENIAQSSDENKIPKRMAKANPRQTCNQCGKALNKSIKRDSVPRHVKSHLPPEFFIAQCRICARTFKDVKQAKRHAKTVHDSEDWVSSSLNWSKAQCVVEAIMQTSLKKIGEAVIAAGRSEEWKCHLCAEISPDLYIASHVWNKHYAKVAFACRHCGFTLSRLSFNYRGTHSALKRHLRAHFPIPGDNMSHRDTLSNYEDNFHGNEELQNLAKQCFPEWAQTAIRHIQD